MCTCERDGYNVVNTVSDTPFLVSHSWKSYGNREKNKTHSESELFWCMGWVNTSRKPIIKWLHSVLLTKPVHAHKLNRRATPFKYRMLLIHGLPKAICKPTCGVIVSLVFVGKKISFLTYKKETNTARYSTLECTARYSEWNETVV